MVSCKEEKNEDQNVNNANAYVCSTSPWQGTQPIQPLSIEESLPWPGLQEGLEAKQGMPEKTQEVGELKNGTYSLEL